MVAIETNIKLTDVPGWIPTQDDGPIMLVRSAIEAKITRKQYCGYVFGGTRVVAGYDIVSGRTLTNISFPYANIKDAVCKIFYVNLYDLNITSKTISLITKKIQRLFRRKIKMR